MATYNELEQRIKELKSRTGKGSISPRETFDLMDELLSKTKGVDMTAQPLVVVKSYDTLALANADRNPINPATNKPLALGQLISITADGTNNAVYRLALLGSDGSPTWEKQAELGDMTNYAKQTDLVQLAGEKTDIEVGYLPYKYQNFLFILGGINSSTGAFVTNDVRLRMTFARSISAGERIEFNNTSPFISQYGLFLYIGSAFIGVTGEGVESITCDGSFDTICYQLKKSDGSAFSESDIQVAKSSVFVRTFAKSDTYNKGIDAIKLTPMAVQPLLESRLPYTVPFSKGNASKSLWLAAEHQNKIRGKYIGSIILEFDKTGTFSVFKGAYIGQPTFQRTLVEKFTVTKTGKQRLTFQTPVFLNPDEWLGVFDINDTSSFVHNNIGGLNGAQHFHYYYGGAWKLTEGSLNITIDNYLRIDNHNLEFSLGGILSDDGRHVENNLRLRSERIFISKGERIELNNNSSLDFQQVIYFDGFKRVGFSYNFPVEVEYDGSFDNFIISFKNAGGTELSDVDADNLRNNISYKKTSMAYAGEKEHNHRYNGKYLSIIGASTNTYDGWIPSGYVTYYPHGSMNSVNQQYWWKLLNHFGMNLLTLNAWSGSRVSSGGSGSISDLGRARLLHRGDKKPDVIIINAGLNDFNHNVPLGNYDGTGTIPTTTDTFSDAYGKMIYDMVTEYALAEIWCCTLQLGARLQEHGYPEKRAIDGVYKSEFNDTIRSIAKHFGVGLIEIDKCGITPLNMYHYACDANEVFAGSGLHPNDSGFDLFFETIRKAWGG